MTDLFEALNTTGVRYLLIGGQAMRLAGMPRFSMDWDFLIPPRDAGNFQKLNDILDEELDAPLIPLGPAGENFIQTYQTCWGVPRFEDAERATVVRKTEHGVAVKSLSGPLLLAAKQAANRPQDQADIEFLLELQRLGKLT